MWETVMAFLAEYTAELGAGAAVLAIIETVFKPFRRMFGSNETVKLDEETKTALAPVKAKDGPALTVSEFIRLRRELKADLEDELSRADETEKSQLRARIAELESQIANPDAALAEAQKRIADLEALLDRSGNEIGGDRIAEAKAALEKGDYSIADDIFAEIEARNDLAVQESARAAYGRGEVAEAEIRWADAAGHYVKAAKRHETYDHLFKASKFLWHAGRYNEALLYSTHLVNFAEAHSSQEDLARALNESGLHLKALGQFANAETQFQRALDIGRATIGEAHPDFAINLNNLATVVQAQGRLEEAEGLYRQALDIDRATIGEEHPHYAIGLNNLAFVVKKQSRFEEAEGLYRQALEIGRATIGEAHPSFATRLNNLAGVVEAQGRLEEAEGLYRQALEIDRTTIGEAHPDFAIDLNNLGGVVEAQGRTEEARPLYEQALAIFKATLPADHPNIAIVEKHIAIVEKHIASLPPAD